MISKHCQKRPRSASHPYCGKTCATAAKQKNLGRYIPVSATSYAVNPVCRNVLSHGLHKASHQVPRRVLLELLQHQPRGVSRPIYVNVTPDADYISDRAQACSERMHILSCRPVHWGLLSPMCSLRFILSRPRPLYSPCASGSHDVLGWSVVCSIVIELGAP